MHLKILTFCEGLWLNLVFMTLLLRSGTFSKCIWTNKHWKTLPSFSSCQICATADQQDVVTLQLRFIPPNSLFGDKVKGQNGSLGLGGVKPASCKQVVRSHRNQAVKETFSPNISAPCGRRFCVTVHPVLSFFYRFLTVIWVWGQRELQRLEPETPCRWVDALKDTIASHLRCFVPGQVTCSTWILLKIATVQMNDFFLIFFFVIKAKLLLLIIFNTYSIWIHFFL